MSGINWSKYSVAQTKDMLVQTGRFTMDDLEHITSQVQLVQMFNDEVDEDVVFQEEEMTVNSVSDPLVIKKPKIPNYSSIEWNEYVLSLFEPDEVDEHGNPLLHGLRRLAELVLGEIVFSGPTEIKAIAPDQDCGWALCTYRLEIRWRRDESPFVLTNNGAVLTTRTFIAVADASKNNLSSGIYSKFPAAMAEARAEGRALRKALGIKVVASEELAEKPTGTQVTRQQINLLNAKCKSLNIDIAKLCASEKIKDLNKTTLESAAKLLILIQKYQTTPQSIPEDLKNEC